MPMTLLELRNHIKSSRGLTRGREDGLIPDSLFDEGIANAIKRVARDCDLLPTTKKVALVAGEWKVPIPEEVTSIIAVWREDTNGSRLPLTHITQAQFDSGRDPADDLTLNPSQFAYPIYEGQPYQFFVKAPPSTDFIATSRITNGSRRTVEDSGANFGRTWSGRRISPGDVVHNKSGLSYGYVENLDMITAKRSGTCASQTTASRVAISGADMSVYSIAVDDIICKPATGPVKTYAFVTSIDGIYAYYDDVRGEEDEFAVGEAIKIGTANKIRLSAEPPHRGLRQGARNYFQVGSVAATLTGTTFTDTRCTGSGVLTSASVGQEAIASGGSHGYIEDIGSNYVDVTCWIGGVPASGETVTIRTCDEYMVETEPKIQPVMFLRPTPSTSDATGEEKLTIHFDSQPFVPTEDYHYIDIPQRWEDALKACSRWQVAILTGSDKAAKIRELKTEYLDEVGEHQSDIHETPRSEIMTPWGNRQRHLAKYGQAYQGVETGIPYDINELLAANDE